MVKGSGMSTPPNLAPTRTWTLAVSGHRATTPPVASSTKGTSVVPSVTTSARPL